MENEQEMMKKIKKDRKERKFMSKCMKAPIRVLSRVRDLYMRSLWGCAGKVSNGPYDGLMAGPYLTDFSRSFSARSSSENYDNDMRELIRVASLNMSPGAGRKTTAPAEEVNVMPRSQSVAGIGRIDEEKPCEFGEDVRMETTLYPRSRSYAVTKRRVSWATNSTET